jgi:hypothetical protein
MIPVRTNYEDAPLRTELQWRPHAINYVRSPKRGALVGTLWGVEVDGKSIGRGVAYQLGMISGEVRTVWWDGTIGYAERNWQNAIVKGVPELYDVDTQEPVLRNPQNVSWFARLQDIEK